MSAETLSDTLSNLQLHLIVWLPRVQFENKDSKGSKQAGEARDLEKRRNETRHLRFRGLSHQHFVSNDTKLRPSEAQRPTAV